MGSCWATNGCLLIKELFPGDPKEWALLLEDEEGAEEEEDEEEEEEEEEEDEDMGVVTLLEADGMGFRGVKEELKTSGLEVGLSGDGGTAACDT